MMSFKKNKKIIIKKKLSCCDMLVFKLPPFRKTCTI